MYSEANTTYKFSFKLKQAHRAAQLAYAAAIESGSSKSEARSRGVKAFLSRRVLIPSATITPNLQAKLKSWTDRMLISRVVTGDGYDPIRKRGVAQSHVHQVVVRTWPLKSVKHNTGHVGISIKSDRSRRLNAAGPDSESEKHLYFTWWPKFDKSAKGRIRKALGYTQCSTTSDYYRDKSGMISPKTDARLMAGHDQKEKAEKQLKEELTKEALDKALASPINQARPRQKDLKKDDVGWGVMADKVYVPVMGRTVDSETGKPVVNIFGLNETHMRMHVYEVKKQQRASETYYHKYDPRNSCSAKALDVLRKGGAELYISLKNYHIWSDPNLVHQSTVALQERIDELNGKVIAFDQAVSGLTLDEVSFPVVRYMEDNQPKNFNVCYYQLCVKDVISHLERLELSEYSRKVQELMAGILSLLREIGERKLNIDAITPLNIRLVESMEKLQTELKTESSRKELFLPVYGALLDIKRQYEVDPFTKMPPEPLLNEDESEQLSVPEVEVSPESETAPKNRWWSGLI